MAVLLKAVHSTSEPKIIFHHFFVSEKGLAHMYIKKQFIIFKFLILALLRAKIEFLAELRLPTMIRKVKLTDFVKRATCPKMQLSEFRFHAKVMIL